MPLLQLRSFEYKKQDDLIYHKDLFDVEYVLGQPIGQLSAPIYAILTVNDALAEYKDYKNNVIIGKYTGTPEDNSQPNFIWT